MPLGELVVHVDLSPAPRQSAALCVLAGFLVSFTFIRMSTRLMRSPRVPWWPGSIETEGGLHVHHLVFGICLLMICGFLSFAVGPQEPWLQILGAGFGVGLGLTLDEFALWLYLDDVYWAEEGRQSVDAVVIAALLGGLVVLGFTPLGGDDTGSVIAVVAALAFVLALSLVTALKGKYVAAVVVMLVPVVGLVTATRLAKPGSPWARRRYAEGSDKLARSRAATSEPRSAAGAGPTASAARQPPSRRRTKAPGRGPRGQARRAARSEARQASLPPSSAGSHHPGTP